MLCAVPEEEEERRRKRRRAGEKYLFETRSPGDIVKVTSPLHGYVRTARTVCSGWGRTVPMLRLGTSALRGALSRPNHYLDVFSCAAVDIVSLHGYFFSRYGVAL